MEIITRKEAKEQGLKYYFTGKPCKRNHVAKRKVTCATCYECHLFKEKEFRTNFPEKRQNYLRNRSQELAEIDKKNKSKYANSEHGKNKIKEYLQTDAGKEARKKALLNYEDKGRNRQYLKKYGITLEQYNVMFEKQKR